jgi:hypothetical protein
MLPKISSSPQKPTKPDNGKADWKKRRCSQANKAALVHFYSIGGFTGSRLLSVTCISGVSP